MRKEISLNKILLVFLVSVFFSGCGFSSNGQKTEIDLKLDQKKFISTKKNVDNIQKKTVENHKSTSNKAKVLKKETAPVTKIVTSRQKTKKTKTVAKTETKNLFTADRGLKIKNDLVSWGYQKYNGTRKIDTIIIHSTYNPLGGGQYDFSKILAIYKKYKVSPHYLIERDGAIYRLVKENNIAYHAGISRVPDNRTNVNNFSIGIEMIGNKIDGYTKAQYNSVKKLINQIKSEYKIKYILGHKDIAPGRKTDPWNFDWKKIKK